MTSVHFTGTRTTTAAVSASVIVRKNGDHAAAGINVNVAVDHQSSTMDDWLVAASKQLDVFPPAQKCFDAFGQVVDDVLQFQDGKEVYLAPHKDDTFVPAFCKRVPCSGDAKNGSGRRDDDVALPCCVGSFGVGQVICRGTMGALVAVAENPTNGEKVCLKFIPKSTPPFLDMDVVRKLDATVQSLTALAGVPGIVQFQQRQDTASHVVLAFKPWVRCQCRVGPAAPVWPLTVCMCLCRVGAACGSTWLRSARRRCQKPR
jgi:hypothetical protein